MAASQKPSRASGDVPFVKMHGAGNDYVYVDAFAHSVGNAPDFARRVSDRRKGVGSDGLILVEPCDDAHARMRMFNADGSESSMCGNGLRCVAKFLFDRGRAPRQMMLRTGSQRVPAEVLREDRAGRATWVRLNLGIPQLERAEVPMTGPPGMAVDEPLQILDKAVPVTAVGLGNPHAVIFVDDVDSFPVISWGTAVQNCPRFPQGVNVEFVEIVAAGRLKQRTFERGSGETLSCGSGAVAACVAQWLRGEHRPLVTVQLRGGALDVEWAGIGSPAFLSGAAIEVFAGRFPTAAANQQTAP